MISYQQAIELIDANTLLLEAEMVALQNIAGRVLAVPVVAPFNMPLFDNSSVDGFAVRSQDLVLAGKDSPVNLKLIGSLQAGSADNLTMSDGEAIRIFTGAPVPCGADAVVMQEHCRVSDGHVSVQRPVKSQENIRKCGAEFVAGTEVLPAGTLVTPPVVGLLASLGFAEFSAGCLPSVALIVTGNELLQPGTDLSPGKIYDSSSAAVLSALQNLGLKNVMHVVVKDDVEKLREACLNSLNSADIVLCTGGVSVGDYDFVKGVFEQIGVETIFWQVSIKPGKPLYFGKFEKLGKRRIVFGLPGNTVSTLVTFHQFVKGAVQRMMHLNGASKLHRGRIAVKVTKHDARLDFMRGRYATTYTGELVATPMEGQQSHMLSGLALANCLIQFPLECECLEVGDKVTIDPINWYPQYQ